ncbi:uncharacterized protein M421DRAFT_4359 [Didymella exigua CBS 183.55]|uniref:Carbohydrate-binding module family 18 protein n=1 Tax=Didymella exigua CBS 183.55 TaxID=1150837 RepID=A0A6A5RNG3_9PLEO|nr:uncharacterized protein M421DRAFT_4359 [Didymella exigua CBS 183.55]KAF1929189.1 hypothetical protein M421DRAFT_4359 [Didymella exigua CBS 183.55]
MQLATTILAGLGLIALASSAPTDTDTLHSATGSTTFWQNTQTQKYHCQGQDVIRCETTAGGTCIAIDTCEAYCFLHDNGAACVDMDAPPVLKIPVSTSEAKFTARSASSEKNEYHECSKDRTGVLICKYRFCSTDYYCKAGDECKDGTFSCAPKSPSLARVKSEARDKPAQVEAVAADLEGKPSYICSKDRASVLKCLFGFCSTDYYCAKGHPCADNPARCKKYLNARTDQYGI